MSAKEPQKQVNAYLKYSGIAFQMLATIALAVWAGIALDRYLAWRFPAATVSFALLGIFASMWQIIKSLPKN
jgi:F0F1-type ATP synthase assembly protein I